MCVFPLSAWLFGKRLPPGYSPWGSQLLSKNLLNVTGMTILNHFASEYGAVSGGAGPVTGNYASGELQLCQREL